MKFLWFETNNPDHNKFSSLSNTTGVAIFPNLCLWRRSLWSNLGGIDPEKLHRATLNLGRTGGGGGVGGCHPTQDERMVYAA